MASRLHVKTQSELLKAELRAACRENRLRPGDAVPPLRQLCADFELSRPVVLAIFRDLCEEGVLHTVERAGTFAGLPRPKERPLFAFFNVAPDLARSVSLKNGFETRIAALGGSVLTLSKEQGRQLLLQGRFPPCAGVFEMTLGIEDTLREFAAQGLSVAAPDVKAHVVFGESDDLLNAGRDSVAFDDTSGGRLATEHLIWLGHERIAFLGIHRNPASLASNVAEPKWSCLRQMGWRNALQDAGVSPDGLAFYGHSSWEQDYDLASDPMTAERETVADFLAALRENFETPSAISAVVTANDHLATHLFSELHRIEWPRAAWPVVVSFDGDSSVQNEVVTSLNLPWEKIGRTAADLLWERNSGVLSGPAIHRAVPMTLIPRLSCRPEWDLASHTHQDAALISSNGALRRQHISIS